MGLLFCPGYSWRSDSASLRRWLCLLGSLDSRHEVWECVSVTCSRYWPHQSALLRWCDGEGILLAHDMCVASYHLIGGVLFCFGWLKLV